jgi:hypothetical protein
MLTQEDIDLFKQDFDSYVPIGEETKLYNIKRCTVVDSPLGKVYFEKLDGSYSICLQCDGSIIHLSASTPVKVCKKGEGK